MSRTLSLLMAVVLSLLLVALAACGGDGGGATETPTTPAGTTAAQTPTGATTTPTQATPTTEGREFSDSATVSAEVGDKSLAFENGKCVKGPDDVWLGVSVGDISSDEYFFLVVGRSTGQEGARSAKGGGVFTGGDIIAVSGAQSGTAFFMRSSEEDKVTVAADLESGEFVGTTVDGQSVSGSFKC